MGPVLLQLWSAYNQDYQVGQLGNWSSRNILRLLAFILQLHLIQIH